MVGKLIILTAPSGAGKTTLVKHLLQVIPRLSFSVSATNRKMRSGETDGKDYYFLSTETFQSYIREDKFVEWEEVYSKQYYGTLRSEVERLRTAGQHIIFDIDVKGALSLKQQFAQDALAVFVMPPSLDILIERLKQRATEDEESLRKRIEKASFEMSFQHEFDETLVNDQLELSLLRIEKIVNRFLGYSDGN
ncbi:MAG: guanylate kinase [Saprospiraceae bacterium]|jgi:guanylate kinase|nr:guanylate kinase [Saprospiraceae bacterium]MDP4822093.1 guanylate kinase [Saprospiraceae bacterium]MDP4999966.1 guanylate kinase [Saprospiraceae bacterium]